MNGPKPQVGGAGKITQRARPGMSSATVRPAGMIPYTPIRHRSQPPAPNIFTVRTATRSTSSIATTTIKVITTSTAAGTLMTMITVMSTQRG